MSPQYFAPLISCTAIFPVLAVVAVILRLVARRVRHLAIAYDDYLVMLALVSAWIMQSQDLTRFVYLIQIFVIALACANLQEVIHKEDLAIRPNIAQGQVRVNFTVCA